MCLRWQPHHLDEGGFIMRVSSGPRKPVIANEVPTVDTPLVLCDKEGTPFTVRYDAVNAMLLNEFLKAHRKNEDKQATIACLDKQVQALTAGLQRMRAQLELNTSGPQTVLKAVVTPFPRSDFAVRRCCAAFHSPATQQKLGNGCVVCGRYCLFTTTPRAGFRNSNCALTFSICAA